MPDVATLGLQVDSSDLESAGAALRKFTSEGAKAEQSATKLASSVRAAGQASEQRARAIDSEARRIAQLRQQEESAAAAHANFLEQRATQESRAAVEQVQRSARSGQAAALAQVQAAERVYRQNVAILKEEQARGLLSPQEASARGQEAAQAYNRAVLGSIETAGQAGALAGRQGQETFTRLASSLKDVDQSTRRAGLGLGRLNNSMVVVARQALGLNSTTGRLVDTVGTFAIGTAYMVPVLAGLAAVGAAWAAITRDAREAKREQDEAIESLRRLQEAQRLRGLGPGGEEAEQVGLVRDRIRDTEALIATLEERLRVEQELGRFAAQEDFGPGLAAITALEGRIRALRGEVEELNVQAEAGEEAARRARSEASRRQGRIAADILDVQGLEGAAQTLRDQLDILDRIADGASEAEIAQTRRLQALRAQVRAQEEARRAAEAERQTLSRAVDLRIAGFTEAERLLQILGDQRAIAEDLNRALGVRVQAAERQRDAEEAINRFFRQRMQDREPTSRLSGGAPGEIFVPDVGPLNEALEDFDPAALTAAERAALLTEEYRSQAEAVVSLTSGLASVLDSFGLLEGESRAAVRGIADLVQGIQAIRTAQLAGGGGLGSVAGIGGILGVAGGIAGLIGGSFGGSRGPDERELAEERNAEALRNATERLREFAAGLAETTRLEGLQARAEETFRGGVPEFEEVFLLPDIGFPEAEVDALVDGARALSAEFDDVDTIMRKLHGDLGGLPPQIRELIRAFVEGLEAAEEAFEREQAALSQTLEVRRLSALGLDEEAHALRDQIELQEAMGAGWTEANIVALEHVQALEAEERAQREAARAAEHFQGFRETLVQAFAAANPDDVEVQQRATRFLGEANIAQTVAGFEDLVDAGDLTQEELDELAAVMREGLNIEVQNLADAAREAEEAAREAAEAERFRAMVDKENLRVRILVAQGLDSEARALRNRLEIQQAIQDGRDAEYLALLRQAQALEARQRAEDAARRATERHTRAIEGRTRVLNAPAGLPFNQIRANVAQGLPAATVRTVEVRAPITVVQRPGESTDELARRVASEVKGLERAGEPVVQTGG